MQRVALVGWLVFHSFMLDLPLNNRGRILKRSGCNHRHVSTVFFAPQEAVFFLFLYHPISLPATPLAPAPIEHFEMQL